MEGGKKQKEKIEARHFYFVFHVALTFRLVLVEGDLPIIKDSAPFM